MRVLPADEAGLHCGILCTIDPRDGSPVLPADEAGLHCGAPVPCGCFRKRVLPADEAGLRCGSFGGLSGTTTTRVLPADEAGLHCGKTVIADEVHRACECSRPTRPGFIAAT